MLNARKSTLYSIHFLQPYTGNCSQHIGGTCTADGAIAAATIVTLFLSIVLGFILGVGVYYSIQMKYCLIKAKHPKRKPGVNLQKNISYGDVQKMRCVAREHSAIQSIPNVCDPCKTEVVADLVNNESYGKVQIEKLVKLRDGINLETDPEHCMPAPYEEPIRTKGAVASTEQTVAHQTEDLAHSYCEVKEEDDKEPGSIAYPAPTVITLEKMKMKPNLSYGEINKLRKEGVEGEPNKEVNK